MRKYEIMQEFLDGDCCGCFIVNDKVVYEEHVRELVDKAISAFFNWIEDELYLNIGGKEVVVSYI